MLITKIIPETDAAFVREIDEISNFFVEQWISDNEDYAYGLYLSDTEDAEEKLIGYCTIGYADDCPKVIANHPEHTCDSLFLSDVFILSPYRYHGYATSMIRSAIQQRLAKEKKKEAIFLQVMTDDLRSLYEQIGFQIIRLDENGFIESGAMVLPKERSL